MEPSDIWAFAATGVLVGTLLALVMAVVWWISARRAARAVKLRPVSGRLDSIATRYVRGAKGSSYWTIETKYTYEVAGESLAGKRPTLEFNSYPTEIKANAVIAGREAGQAVTVWYDPDKPSWSSLDNTAPKSKGYRVLTTIFLAIAVASGIVVYIYS